MNAAEIFGISISGAILLPAIFAMILHKIKKGKTADPGLFAGIAVATFFILVVALYATQYKSDD